MKIKLYRFTIKHTVPLRDSEYVSYYQTDWRSEKNYVVSENKEILLVEEKYVNLNKELVYEKK